MTITFYHINYDLSFLNILDMFVTIHTGDLNSENVMDIPYIIYV
jgi:hypothetical protein